MVRIMIYNQEGRLVDRLDTGVLTSGLNTVRWDAVSRHGRAMRKGIFTCIIESGTEQMFAKIVMH